jgi:protein involved in polysaccharide export with SLBB domain
MRPHTIIEISFVLASLLTQNATARAQTAPVGALAPQAGDLVLQPGDHVKITVIGEDKDLSGEFEVAPDGTLKHPLYSQVKVAGVPLPVLKEQFGSFLRRFQKQPKFEVEPLFKVGVAGEVRTPNIYFLAPETTIGEALTRANGATERGDSDHVTVLRDGEKISLDLSTLASNRDQPKVRSGDQINVPTRRSVVSGISAITPLIGVAASLLSLTIVFLSHR